MTYLFKETYNERGFPWTSQTYYTMNGKTLIQSDTKAVLPNNMFNVKTH